MTDTCDATLNLAGTEVRCTLPADHVKQGVRTHSVYGKDYVPILTWHHTRLPSYLGKKEGNRD